MKNKNHFVGRKVGNVNSILGRRNNSAKAQSPKRAWLVLKRTRNSV